MKKASLLVGALAGILFLGAGCSQAPEEAKKMEDTSPIKIGFLGPLTGDVADPGKNLLGVTQMAVDEVNAAGGINGRNLEIIAEDGKCTPKDAADAGNKLINVDKVTVILGGLCSGETLSVAPVAEQNKVILISPGSSAPNITTAGDYIFRTYPSDSFQGKVGADYVYNSLGKRKAAVLASLGDYGTGLKNSFIDSFKALGGEVVYAEDFAQDTKDFRTQLTKIKASNADVVYFVSYTEAAIAGLRQAKELGVKLPFFAGDTWDDAKVQANSFSEGIMFTVGSAGVKSDKKDEFEKKLTAKGFTNTVGASGGYNNVNIIADIMKRVGTDATAIKNELYKVKDYPGVSGSITIDSNGDLASAGYDIKVVNKGKAVVLQENVSIK